MARQILRSEMPSRRIISLIIVALASGFAGCAWSPVEPYAGRAAAGQNLYVVASGWHTELGIPAETISGPLASLRSALPHARYFVFAWGQRDYYMAQQPGFGDLVGAAIPAPSVMLVVPLEQAPPAFFIGASVFTIAVSQEGLSRLSQFLWDYLEKDLKHLPRRVGDGPYPDASFYASTSTYSLANTCNTWTAEALRVAGLPVSATGVVFAHQVLDQVRELVVPQQ